MILLLLIAPTVGKLKATALFKGLWMEIVIIWAYMTFFDEQDGGQLLGEEISGKKYCLVKLMSWAKNQVW